jgi:hypothetical protein
LELEIDTAIITYWTANMTYGQWWRMPANDTVFQGMSPVGIAYGHNWNLDYPSRVPVAACKSRNGISSPYNFGTPDVKGAVNLQASAIKSNVLVMVPAQAGSTTAASGCTWTLAQIEPE